MPQRNLTKSKTIDSIEEAACPTVSREELSAIVSDRRVKKALSLLHADPQQDWCWEDLAKQFHLSLFHFRRLFVANVGIGPSEYLCNLRLSNARQLLATTELRLHEIANVVGLSSELALRRAFKKKFAICPSRYRENMPDNVAKCPIVSQDA